MCGRDTQITRDVRAGKLVTRGNTYHCNTVSTVPSVPSVPSVYRQCTVGTVSVPSVPSVYRRYRQCTVGTVSTVKMTVRRGKGRLEWRKQHLLTVGQNWKALACIVWDLGARDTSGVDGPKVATEH